MNHKFMLAFTVLALVLCVGAVTSSSDSSDADNLYSIHFDSNNTTYGDVDYMNVTVEEGSTYSASGNTMVITEPLGNTTTVTATPINNDPQYSHAFDYWSDTGGTVNGDVWITAYFTETLIEYTVTFTTNDATMGDVSTNSIIVPAGSYISANDNSLSIGPESVYAYTMQDTVEYTYAFDSWTGLTEYVNGNMTITANFTATLNTYTVTIQPNESTWGTVSTASVTVDYGTSYSTSGSTLTIGSYTITATPTVSDAQYRYTFEGWSSYSGTIESDDSITAYFSANLKEYTVTIDVASPVYGSVDTPSYTAHYGDLVSVSDNILTIGTDTITATPYSQTTDTTYSFDRWANVPNSITGDVTITAYFTSSVRDYLVHIAVNYSDWGKVCYSGTSTEVTQLYIPYGSTYFANGDTMTISTSSGNIVLVAIPSDDTVERDYSFSAWSPASGTILGNFTLTAFFNGDIQQYSFAINYNPNYGSLSWSPSSPITSLYYGNTYSVNGNNLEIYDSTNSLLATVTPVPATDTAQYDYEFDHWYPTSGTITGNTVVNANFSRTLNHCEVTFMVNDSTYGTVDVNSVTVDYGTSFTINNNVLTVGNTTVTATPKTSDEYVYTFDNWSKIPGAGNTITGNTIFEAVFTRSVHEYTITFVSEAVNDPTNHNWGSIDYNTLTVPYGTSVTNNYDGTLTIGSTVVTATPSSPTDTYTYVFWSWDTLGHATIGEDVTFTAYFTRTDRLYTVTFQVNEPLWGHISIVGGGYNDEPSNSILVGYGTPITEQDTHTSFQGMLIFGNSSSVRTYSVYAQAEQSTVEYEYAFDHWSVSSGTVTSDMTITVYFTSTHTQCTVYITAGNGGSVDIGSVTVDYGTTYSVYENTLTIGSTTVTATPDTATVQYWYDFNRWSSESGTVTGSLNIQAIFSTHVQLYTVTIVPNDSSYGSVSSNSISVGYNSLITTSSNQLDISSNLITATPSAPTSEYQYAFDSWSPSSGRVTGDMTITANFTRDTRTYTVSFVPNDSSYGSVDVPTVNVLYGTTYTSSNNELTIDGQTITATNAVPTAQYTYTFGSWTPSSGTITGNTTITANFTPVLNRYTVTIAINESGWGTVDTNSVTVDYGSSISVNNDVLTIGSDTVTATPTTATAQYTYTFGSWTPSTGTVEGTMTVTANFVRTVNQYTVTIQVNESGWGTVNRNSVTVDYGTSIQPIGNRMYLSTYTITATPSLPDSEFEYEFTSWSPTSGTITGPTVITANFSQSTRTYIVTISSNEAEWGNVDVPSVRVLYGTTYSSSGNTLTIGTETITATPSTATNQYQYAFDSWSPSSGTITGDDTITAVFTRSLVQYTVSIVSDNTSWGTVNTPSVTVDYGTVITANNNVLNVGNTPVTATPVTADVQYTYSFDEWSDTSVVVTNDRTITAYFTRTINQYTVSIVSDNTSWGTVNTPSVTVDYGTSFSTNDNVLTVGNNTITATPASPTSEYQYAFDSWTPSSGTVNGDITITAYFTQETRKYTVTFAVNESDWGTVDTPSISNIEYGTTFSVSNDAIEINNNTVTATPTTATAQYTYAFDSWSPSSGTVTGDMTIMAYFTRTLNQYVVTIVSNDTSYGDVDVSSVTVDYGTAVSSNGNILTVGSDTITATPETATAQYTYSFVRWTNATGTVTGDKTITANFTRTVNQYTVTFVPNDSEYGTVNMNSVTVNYGTAYASSTSILNMGSYSVIATPSNPTSEYQYSFGSWSPSSGTITGDTTITANFIRSVRTYTITFQVNESGWGSVSDSTISGIDYGTSYTVSGDTFNVGSDSVTATPAQTTIQYVYGFDYWSPSAGTVTGDMTVTAYFTRALNQYTVTIVTNEATWGTVDVNSVTVDYGTVPYTYENTMILGTTTVTATPSVATSHYSYEFDSWSNASTPVTSNKTITANFSRITNTYTIHFAVNDSEYGSVAPVSIIANYGDVPSVSGASITISGHSATAVPTTDTAQYNYEFDSWTGVPSEITGETTITANFTRSIQVYTVNIAKNENWGSVSTSLISVEYGTTYSTNDNVLTVGESTITATPYADTSHYDYGFDSWSSSSGTITGPTVITAYFTRDLVQYTVTIQVNESGWGTVSESTLSIDYGTSFSSNGDMLSFGSVSVDALPAPSTVQYVYSFGSWSPSSGTVTGDMTITANFVRNLTEYDVTIAINEYDWGTVSVQMLTVEYGTSISVSDNTLSLGNDTVVATPAQATAQYRYSFDFWSPSSGSITDNTVITANFARTGIEYSITFTANNNEYGGFDKNSITAGYGDIISVSDNVFTIGTESVTAIPTTATAQYTYGFVSWNPSNGTVTGDMTVIATFNRTINNYTVQIQPNNSYYGSVNVASVTVPYGTTVSANGNVLSLGQTNVTATPTGANAQYRYIFVDWSEDSGYISENTTILANFDRETIAYRITIQSNNTSWGNVDISSVVVDYGTIVNFSQNRLYIETMPVTIVTATPTQDTARYNYEFASWSISGELEVVENVTITATFERTLFAYTVTFVSSNNAWGTIDTNSVTAPYGTPISANGNVLTVGNNTITAIPHTDTPRYEFDFVSWSQSEGTVTEDIEITATFSMTIVGYHVTIQTSNSFWGDVDKHSVVVPYESSISAENNVLYIGDEVITATPTQSTAQYEYAFGSWSTDSGEVVENMTITANFTRSILSYLVTIWVNEYGWGTVSQSQILVEYGTEYYASNNVMHVGDEVSTATPTARSAQYDYGFEGWDDTNGTVTGDKTLTAQFTRSLNQYDVTFVSNNTDWGTVSASEVTVDYGTIYNAVGSVLHIGDLDVIATPATDTAEYTYEFTGWNVTHGEVESDTEIIANFTRTTNQYTVTVLSNNTEWGTVSASEVEVDYGTAIATNGATLIIGSTTVLATPTEDTDEHDYIFLRWSNVPATVTEDITVMAYFAMDGETFTLTFTVTDGRGYWTQPVIVAESGAHVFVNGKTVTVGDYSSTLVLSSDTKYYKYTLESISVPSVVTQDANVSANVSRTATVPAFNIIQPEQADDATTKLKEGPAWTMLLVVPILAIIGAIIIAMKFGLSRDDYNDF